MKGLYFYKLVSPYKEDVTKDCKLTINEIDSNFINLKDADVKSLVFNKEDKKLTLTRNDGEKFITDLSSLDKHLNVEWNKKEGILTITHGEEKFIVDGIITTENVSKGTFTEVITDETLIGNGTCNRPLGIKPLEKTGQYKACLKYVDVVEGESLPSCQEATKGDRYLTYEKISDFGYLYDYYSVKVISKDLDCGWRIPTKEDWDNMLNAIEPCEEFKNHNETICNQELGKAAGKLLKSTNYWLEEIINSCSCTTESNCGCNGEHPKKKINPKGVDWYHMGVKPVGYGDGNQFLDYFGKRCGFWTSSDCGCTDVYVKRFDYKMTGVLQTSESPRSLFALRLVKDYNGHNFNETEVINGQVYNCCLLPSENTECGYAIWLASNVGFNDDKYQPRDIASTEGVETYSKGYFTCEWDGKHWIKKQMDEGDSVVLIEGKDEDKPFEEYRLENGELICVSASLYETIYEKIEDEINTERERINELASIVNDEIDRAISAETALADMIEAESERAQETEERLTEAVASLREDLDENIELTHQLSGDLATEIDRAINKEIEIEGRLISQEGSTMSIKDGVLTLNTVNPDNTIIINFNSNYGTF